MKKSLISFFIIVITFVLSSCKTGIMLENGKTLKINDNYLPWTLTLFGEDIKIEKKESSDFSKYVLFNLQDESVNVSLFIEPAYITNKSEEYRDASIENSKKLYKGITGIIKTNTESYSQSEFLIPEIRGREINMYDIRRHFIKDGFWIDLHISKVFYSEENNDKEFMLAFLDSIKFVPKNKHEDMFLSDEYNKNKFIYLINSGISYYYLENPKGSKKYLLAAKEMKEAEPSLENEKFPFALFLLSTLHLYDENNNKALQVLNYGASVYPNNVYIQYGLSLVYSNMNDMDNTIIALYKVSENIDEWEDNIPEPAPLENEIYKKFWQNKEFIRAVNEMKFKK